MPARFGPRTCCFTEVSRQCRIVAELTNSGAKRCRVTWRHCKTAAHNFIKQPRALACRGNHWPPGRQHVGQFARQNQISGPGDLGEQMHGGETEQFAHLIERLQVTNLDIGQSRRHGFELGPIGAIAANHEGYVLAVGQSTRRIHD